MSKGDSSKGTSASRSTAVPPPASSRGGASAPTPPTAAGGASKWAGGGGKRIIDQARASSPPRSAGDVESQSSPPPETKKHENTSFLASLFAPLLSCLTLIFRCCFPSSSPSTSPPVPPPDYSTFTVSGGLPTIDWSLVASSRASASSAYSQMSSFKRRSQEAYAAGDKASAHELSLEGKKWGAAMDEENGRAKGAIFSGQNWRGDRSVDLHGLFVEEARDVVETVLDYFAQCPPPVDFVVVTGAGHHSSNHQPLIKPMVEKELRKRGYRFETVHGEGAFHVTIDGGKQSNSYI